MARYVFMCLLSASLSIVNFGCMGRMFSEGMATVTGAAGRVVYVTRGTDFAKYKGIKIEQISVSPGLKVSPEMPELLRSQFLKVAQRKGLTGDGQPMLKLSGEIIHYESGGIVDAAIGPLEEVIVRCKLSDASTNELLTEANLIGRSKATTSSGARNLAEGEGKAFSKWLKEHGFISGEDPDNE